MHSRCRRRGSAQAPGPPAGTNRLLQSNAADPRPGRGLPLRVTSTATATGLWLVEAAGRNVWPLPPSPHCTEALPHAASSTAACTSRRGPFRSLVTSARNAARPGVALPPPDVAPSAMVAAIATAATAPRMARVRCERTWHLLCRCDELAATLRRLLRRVTRFVPPMLVLPGPERFDGRMRPFLAIALAVAAAALVSACGGGGEELSRGDAAFADRMRGEIAETGLLLAAVNDCVNDVACMRGRADRWPTAPVTRPRRSRTTSPGSTIRACGIWASR